MDKSVIALIAICLIVTGALIGSFIKMKQGFGPFNLKVYGLTLIIGTCAILALTEIKTEQLTPAYSIMAAIAGYLFGLKSKEDN